jgi:hypothetical protein
VLRQAARNCCEAFLSDASVRYAHRLLRAASGCSDGGADRDQPSEGSAHLAPVPVTKTVYVEAG